MRFALGLPGGLGVSLQGQEKHSGGVQKTCGGQGV